LAAQLGGLHAGKSDLAFAAGTTRVTLRPATNNGTFESARRITSPGAEGVLLESADARRSVSFLVDSKGVAAIAQEGRGVRFVSNAGGKDVVLAAPTVVGHDQRPSIGARWAVEHDGSGSTTIRLVITDRSIIYPAAAVWASAGRATVRSNALENGTGSIQGQVTSNTGRVVSKAQVLLFDGNGEYMDFADVDGRGGYNLTGLGTGSYRLLLLADGYQFQLYNGIPCPDGDCNIAGGTAVAVTDGFLTSDKDFVVTNQRTLVSGTVEDDAGNPLQGVTVVVVENDGTPRAAAASDENGAYLAEVPTGGTYYARTYNSVYPGLVNQVYSGINCTTCNALAGTAISVTTGTEHGNIDFALRTGGRIAGQVTDSVDGSGLGDRVVSIYNNAGQPVSYGVTGADGNYASHDGLLDGTYYAGVSTEGYTPQVYDDINCSTGCNVTSGTGVAVSLGATVNGIDFSLSQLKIFISGSVVAAGTQTPLVDVRVSAYDEAGRLVKATLTDVSGNYAVLVDAPGDYYLRTDSHEAPGHVDQLYRNIDCSGCAVTGGLKVGTTPNHPAEGIDFALASDGGNISGRIVNSGNNPVTFAAVVIYSASGEVASEGHADSNGDYSLDRGLTAGTYYAVAYADGYEPTLYGGGFCNAGCDPTTGTPISVTRGATTAGINLTLNDPSAHITGNVVAGDTSQPLEDVAVGIYDGSGTLVSSASTDANGSYDAALPAAGTYYARTANTTNPGYADQLYDGIECINCDPTTGTPIAVSAGNTTAGINFALPVGCSPINVNPAGVPNTAVGSSYTATFTAAGGTGAVTFTASEGTVPPGLSLNAGTGVLSGTPNTAGTFVFVIKATDTRGCSGEREYTIVVALATTTTTLTSSPASPNFADSITLTATVAPATATGSVVFREGATQLADVAVSGGHASFNIGTRAPGTYTFTATYGGDLNHNPSTGTLTLVVTKATPVFSDLLSPTIIIGTASVTFTGKLAAGALIPTGTVAITLNGVTQNATISATGTFSATFSTGSLTPALAGYTVTYAFAGNTNFNPASASSLLTVTYGFTGGPTSNGSPVPFRVQLRNAAGVNISSASITVTAYGVRPVGTTTWLPVDSTGNQGLDLKFQNADDGSYKFNLAKGNRPAGQYELGFKVSNDPVIHIITFTMP
jgi:hypothetical protein